MAIATAKVFWEIATNPKTIHILILFLIFFSSTYFWTKGVYGANPNFTDHQQQFFIYKVVLSLFFGISVLAPILHSRNKLFRIIWFIGISLLIYVLIKWNFQSIFYMIQHWGKLMENYSPNWKLQS